MNKSIKSNVYNFALFCFMVTSCVMTIGCGSKNIPEDSMAKQARYAEYFQEQHKAVLIPMAESALGVPYKFGGTTMEGFDCSGFVRWAYSYAGVKLPRTAREQSKLGTAISDRNGLEVGDIVAFYNRKRGYHTGIYVGDGKFVHSPSRRKKVQISKLSNPYFNNSYLGARRVVYKIKSSEIVAAAELIRQYELRLQAKTKAKKSSKKSS